MHLQRDQFGPAKRLLEEVHRKHPDNADVLRVRVLLNSVMIDMEEGCSLDHAVCC